LHAVFEINSAEEHLEGLGFEVKLGFGLIVGLGSSKTTSLKTFHQNPKSGPIPIEHFDTVGTLVEEDEELGRKRVFFELFSDDAAEGVETFSKITGLSGETDLDAVSEDHGCEVAGVWIRRVRPPGKVSSTKSRRGGDTEGVGSSSSMKGTVSVVLFLRASRRHRKKV
jgi:hypothetical protein